ncbi:MAG: signal peptidase I [Candidatus Methylarchaceae archaeon HK02M2]|nr:signal peptidase I [Candidatus Methylarchaceae archaeon HK02M2]
MIDRKDLFKTVSYVAIILIVMGAIWVVPRVALGTTTPFLSVSGPSMEPTLNDGDYIIIKADTFDSLSIGDIIVFYHPYDYKNEIIVHRIYDINLNSEQVLRTKGDNNNYPDPWYIEEEDYIGKFTGIKIPYLGYLAQLFPLPLNYALVIIILLIILLIELYPLRKEEDKENNMKIPRLTYV